MLGGIPDGNIRRRSRSEQAPFHIFTAFVFSYGIGTPHVSRNFLLTAVLATSILSLVSIPVFGHLSDQTGRKNMYMIGAAATRSRSASRLCRDHADRDRMDDRLHGKDISGEYQPQGYQAEASR